MGIGNIGWSEFLVILALALVFFGPRRLPEIANALGKSLREFRKALNEVRSEISQASEPSRAPSSVRAPGAPGGSIETTSGADREDEAGEPEMPGVATRQAGNDDGNGFEPGEVESGDADAGGTDRS